MSTYLQIPLPRPTNANWYKDLRNRLQPYHIKWSTRNFHITLAFIDKTITDQQHTQLIDRLNAYFSQHPLPGPFHVEKLIAFTSLSNKNVIALTSTQITEIKQLRDDITAILNELQIEYNPRFLVHLTLAKDISPDIISLDAIKQNLQSVQLPSFPLPVTKVEYIQQQGHIELATWP